MQVKHAMIHDFKNNAETSLRTARYAGSWYESDPKVLEQQLTAFLKKAEPIIQKSEGCLSVRAIVVPHAGYLFSGEVAAHAYRAAKNKKVKRIFLLGPSHYVGFHGVALPNVSFFETPLGSLAVDQEVIEALKKNSLFVEQSEAHRLEHSLEMQLPFIKKVFGTVPIVPLVVGTLSGEVEIREVAAWLQRFLQEDDLIVVSSDFTHYGPQFQYQPFDTCVRENIRKLNRKAYVHLQQLDLHGFLKFQKETGDTICGLYPLALLLAIIPSNTPSSLVAYQTSQDTKYADPKNSVSYLAITFS